MPNFKSYIDLPKASKDKKVSTVYHSLNLPSDKEAAEKLLNCPYYRYFDNIKSNLEYCSMRSLDDLSMYPKVDRATFQSM